MKWSRSRGGWMIVMAGMVGMLITTQPAAKPGIKAQENTTKIVTRCGSSSGHSFYFPGSWVAVADAGWRKDGISSGQILLIYNGDEPDIIFIPATKQIKSARAEGTLIEVEGSDPGFRLILVDYQDGTIDHYLFGLDENGSGTVAWGTIRPGGIIRKSSLFSASCQAP